MNYNYKIIYTVKFLSLQASSLFIVLTSHFNSKFGFITEQQFFFSVFLLCLFYLLPAFPSHLAMVRIHLEATNISDKAFSAIS